MKAYKWILCIVLVVALGYCFFRFAGVQNDDPAPQTTTPAVTAQEPAVTEFTFSPDAYTARLLSALNAYRERFGAPAWTVNDSLSAAAQSRASECSILGSKSHTRPDGSEWYTVLQINENYNYSEVTGISGHSPDDLLRSWVASDSINNGLVSPEYTACGIGCEAIGSDVYCVLILYKP